MSEFKDRIKEVRTDQRMTQAEFGDLIGTGRQAIAFYEGGYRKPHGAAIAMICERFHVNKEWLLTGNGEKYIQKESAPIGREQEVAEIVTSIMTGANDDFRLRLIKAITKLTPEQLEYVKDVVVSLAEAAKKE